MKKVTLTEIAGLPRYEEMRPEFRRRIIEMKKHRRVSVGDWVTFVFENHDTALFQIQEMLRAEHIVDVDKIRDEIEVYNDLVPEPGTLSATMLIEITEADRIREQLLTLSGIDEAVRMEIGQGDVVRAQFEPGRSKADKLSAVQYVRFVLGDDARRAFLYTTQPVRLIIDHPNYHHAAVLEDNVRRSLIEDLEAP